MKASLIKIGNSRGLRIPKPVLAACGFENQVEMEVKDRTLIIRSEQKPRSGWNEAFRSMRQHGEDALIDPEAISQSSQWDENEWEWQ